MMERNSEKGKNIVKENEAISVPDDVKSQCFQKLPLLSKAFLSESIAKPRILFTSDFKRKRWFHSILQEKPPELWSPKDVFLPRMVCDSFRFVSQMVLGLVCCHEEGKSGIYNPSIGNLKALPKVDLSNLDEAFFFLGFDKKSQKFKVLCVVTGPKRMEYLVISLEDQWWRNVDCEISHIPTSFGLWLDGNVYYAACSKTNEDHFFIMSFNLENEEFSIISSIPEESNSGLKYQKSLVKINDKLALVKSYPQDEAKIWILEATTWSNPPIDIPHPLSFDYDCIGTIGANLFIFAPRYVPKGELYHIICYDFGKQHRQKIIIEGGGHIPKAHVDVFVDYIENPTLNSSENI